MENQIKNLRLKHAWTQEQLAELSSLSIRTIQRVENGETPSLETLAALASVFDVKISQLTNETRLEDDEIDNRINCAKQRIRDEVKLIKQVAYAVIICILLFIINRIYTPQKSWALWVIAIWGGLLVIKIIKLLFINRIISQWEEKRIQKLIK